MLYLLVVRSSFHTYYTYLRAEVSIRSLMRYMSDSLAQRNFPSLYIQRFFCSWLEKNTTGITTTKRVFLFLLLLLLRVVCLSEPSERRLKRRVYKPNYSSRESGKEQQKEVLTQKKRLKKVIIDERKMSNQICFCPFSSCFFCCCPPLLRERYFARQRAKTRSSLLIRFLSVVVARVDSHSNRRIYI